MPNPTNLNDRRQKPLTQDELGSVESYNRAVRRHFDVHGENPRGCDVRDAVLPVLGNSARIERGTRRLLDALGIA